MQPNDFKAFSKILIGTDFNDPQLFMTAFTHRSYINEHKKSANEHNERLEFLGDAVLELSVTEYLYAHYDEPEGVLTNWRAALVRTESICAAATRLGFVDYLRLSRGEKRGSDRARDQILANTFEAVIGAIYLDQGYEAANEFIHKNIISTLDEILEKGSWLDAKTKLQEQVQSEEGFTPQYRVISEEGPDHEKEFEIGVYVDNELRGKGKGHSKQTAQQAAAEQALKKAGVTPVTT
ncbi:MAG: ribonuclease III [Patescibacteria group bacterium]